MHCLASPSSPPARHTERIVSLVRARVVCMFAFSFMVELGRMCTYCLCFASGSALQQYLRKCECDAR